LYNPEDVVRLRLIAEALALGLRAGQIVPASVTTLKEILRKAPLQTETETLLTHARNMNIAGMDRALSLAFTAKGLDAFLTEELGPFLYKLGEEWAAGEVDVHQEHFASNRARAFLEGIWRPLANGRGQPIVLATLPGERHDLGLHMAACVIVSENIPVLFLGSEVPISSLNQSIVDLKPRAVMLGVTQHTSESNKALVQNLVKMLPENHPVFLGGEAAGVDLGLPVMSTLVELRVWCQFSR